MFKRVHGPSYAGPLLRLPRDVVAAIGVFAITFSVFTGPGPALQKPLGAVVTKRA
jgi:hypothetical protein